jgi:hypothetical protein
MSKDYEILKKCESEIRTDVRKWLKDRLRGPILERFNRLYLSPQDYKEFREHYCQICGKPKTDPKIYFGQEFCGKCVEECDPRGIYQILKAMRGWKFDIRKLFRG